MKLTRKEFLQGVVAVGAGGVLAACGSPNNNNNNNNSDAGPPDCTEKGAESSLITGNHGHSVNVPKEDVVAGVDKTYNIQGSAPHNHTITVTAAMFAQLADNVEVTVTSSEFFHVHDVTLTCI